MKLLLIDRQGIIRAIVRPGEKLPPGVVAGKGWVIKTVKEEGEK